MTARLSYGANGVPTTLVIDGTTTYNVDVTSGTATRQ